MEDGALSSDDDIEASRAPLLDHLTELRSRLFIAVVAISAASAVAFFFAARLQELLVEPYVTANNMIAAKNHLPPPEIDMIFTQPMEQFFAQLKIALSAGVVVAFPVVAYQLYAFVAPGLYKREKNAVLPFLIAAPIMFVLGAAFAYFVAIPFAMTFAMNTQIDTGKVHIKLVPKVNEYLSFVITLILAFGACFQLPVVLSLMARAGLVGAGILRKGRRFAVLGIATFAACFTPPDVISMTIMAVPVYALYEISILLVSMIGKARDKEDAADLAAMRAQ
jgi:sec-independent protein translocase protein TatC